MFKATWSKIIKVPHAKTDIERIKYRVLRGIVFSFGTVLFLATVLFAYTSDLFSIPSSPADLAIRSIWISAGLMFWAVWILLGTRWYRQALLPWALGYAANAAVLVPTVATEGTVYRVQIFLLVTLLIFSVYVKKRNLYLLAALYYGVLLFGIGRAGLLQPRIFFPFTLASVFAISAMELVIQIRGAEARLREIERVQALQSSRLSTLGETTAFIVHEVTSPLTILNGHLALIRKEENFDYHIERMQNALSRAIEFMNSVKRMVRANAADEYEIVGLSEILKMVSDLVEPSMRRRNVKLEFDYTDDVELKCRPAEIAQVVLNFINNSADAIGTQPERWIKVTCKETEACLDIEVTDPGAGIDRALGRRIMDPFFTTKPTGSGIGLAIAQQVATHHDGRIDITSYKNPTTIRMRVALVPEFVASGRMTGSVSDSSNNESHSRPKTELLI